MPVGQYDAYADFIRPAVAIAGIISDRRKRELEEQRIGAAIASQRAADLLAQEKFGFEQNKFGIEKEKIQQEIAASQALTALNKQKLEAAQSDELAGQEYRNYLADRSNELLQNRMSDFVAVNGFPALTAEVTEGIRTKSVLDAANEAIPKMPPHLIEPAISHIQDRQSREKIAVEGHQRALEVENLRYNRAMDIADKQYQRAIDVEDIKDKYRRDQLAQRATEWMTKAEALRNKMNDLDKGAFMNEAAAIRNSTTLTDDEKATRLESLYDAWNAKLSGQPPPAKPTEDDEETADIVAAIKELERMELAGETQAKVTREKSGPNKGKFKVEPVDWTGGYFTIGEEPISRAKTRLQSYLQGDRIGANPDFQRGKYKGKILVPGK